MQMLGSTFCVDTFQQRESAELEVDMT